MIQLARAAVFSDPLFLYGFSGRFLCPLCCAGLGLGSIGNFITVHLAVSVPSPFTGPDYIFSTLY